jgi:hypothetical protein
MQHILRFLAFLPTILFSQQFTNIDFNVNAQQEKVYITYDLNNCPSRRLYDIKLSFVDRNRQVIRPTTLSGDIHRVRCGSDKRITWDVLADRTAFQGEYQAVLEVQKKHLQKIRGGPGNVVFSVLMPGMGNLFVSDKSKAGAFLLTGLVAGSVAIGLSYHAEAQKLHQQYRQASTHEDINRYYTEANKEYRTFQAWLGVAGILWLGDIAAVTMKGINNRKEQLRRYSQNASPVQWSFAATPQQFQVSAIKKF